MATNKSNGKPAQTKPLRAVGYCRTSGEGQRDNTSIPTQKQAIESFCQQNGWTVIRFYVDECKSGAKITGRDEFQKMLKDAANKKFDAVVPFDTTRLGRDGVDIVGNAKFLKTNFGIVIVDTKYQFDNRTARNVLTNFVQAGVSEQERVSIMERMMGGRISKAKEGKPWTSQPPVGRTYDKEKERWHVTDKGKAIAEVLRRYVEGESLKTLCAELGISRAAKISGYVNHGQLAGTYKARFHSPEIEVDEEVPVPAIPEVVPSALLEKAKGRLRHNRTFNRHDTKSYVLTGFVRCRDCGKALSGQTGSGGTVYYRHRASDGCTVKGVRGDEVEQAVLDYLFNTFLDQPSFDEAVRRSMPSDKHRKGLLKEQARAKKRLAKCQREIDRLVDAVAKGTDKGLLLSKQDALKAEREAQTRRLEELDHEIATMPSVEQTQRAAMVTRLRLSVEHKGKDWRKLAFEDVRRMLLHLFGETTPENGTGILVRRDERGRLVATLKGQIDFHKRIVIVNGRPVRSAMEIEEATMNASIRSEFMRAAQAADEKRRRAKEELDEECRRAMEELKPYTANQSPGATRPKHGGPQTMPQTMPTTRGTVWC